jgi:hypothetical protein
VGWIASCGKVLFPTLQKIAPDGAFGDAYLLCLLRCLFQKRVFFVRLFIESSWPSFLTIYRWYWAMIAGPDLSRIQNFGDSREGYGVMAVPLPRQRGHHLR